MVRNSRLTTEDLKNYEIELIADDEVFTRLPRFKYYYISNYGRLVKEQPKNGKLHSVNPEIVPNGYIAYKLLKPNRKYRGKPLRYENGKLKYGNTKTTAQRLVAMVYVNNYYGEYAIDDLQVHHKDKNRQNNYFKNLIWLSLEDHKFIHKIKKIAIYNQNNGTYRTYRDIEYVAKLCKLNIREFLDEIKSNKNHFKSLDGKWANFYVNNKFIGIQWFKREVKK